MIAKALAGACVALVLALAIAFWLLLDTRENLGRAREDIENAAETNARLALSRDKLEQNRRELVAAINEEREARQQAQAAKEAAESARANDVKQAQRELDDAIQKLSATERVCVDALVPASLIASLHEQDADL